MSSSCSSFAASSYSLSPSEPSLSWEKYVDCSWEGVRKGPTFLDSILLRIISKRTPSECSRLGTSMFYEDNQLCVRCVARDLPWTYPCSPTKPPLPYSASHSPSQASPV